MPETLLFIATTAFSLEGITKRGLTTLSHNTEKLSSHTAIATPVALEAKEGDWGELLRCLARTCSIGFWKTCAEHVSCCQNQLLDRHSCVENPSSPTHRHFP